MDKYVEIGFVKKTHGVNGELKFSVEDAYWDDFENVEVLFLDVAGRKTPFFLESYKIGHLNLIKFEDISSPEEAGQLTNRPLFMRQQDISTRSTDQMKVEDMFTLLPGYFIKQVSGEDVGKILEVLEFPQQIMAVVDYNGKEVFIPLNDAFIQEIDQEQQVIMMELPEGLLEL
ncbi:MAG: 16S rRNA processing protein RimM [Bacteroidetes bacterium]|nr:MAG: 16S rRNA processing protein RimM [Bacteroidota bacterium]